MQDKYVGDIGDYGKLTLLRQLAKSGLQIGIVWCAVEGENEKNNDGSLRKYRSYSGKHCLKDCDSKLFEQFSIFDVSANRKIKNLHRFIPDATFFNSYVATQQRKNWHEEALKATKPSELIFFDPDNGIGPRDSHKHISLDELGSYWNRKQSLLIYHHLARKKGGHNREIEDILVLIKDKLIGCQVEKFHFRRGTSRVFFLVMQPHHEERLCRAIESKPWQALTYSKSEWLNHRS